jgi:hypothetical protein
MSHIIENNNDTLIVSFGSMGRGKVPISENMNMTRFFDFFNFLPDNFKNVDLHFYADLHQYCFHRGIYGISKNIDETIKYLREKIGNRYKKVIFMGLSGGGYASILFGSILNVSHVVAFYPKSRFTANRPYYSSKYKDLLPYINKTTKYIIYAVTKPKVVNHDPAQCERLRIYKNVIVKKYDISDNIKLLMQECNLYEVLYTIINDRPPDKPSDQTTPTTQTAVDQTTVGQTAVDQTTVGQTAVDQTTVGQTAVDQTADK